MITPQFTLEQSDTHVAVTIRVPSIHCKLSEAQFDICGDQFTFYCKPYYLRLLFNEQITEGKDERAVYDPLTNTVRVSLPKLRGGEHFTRLDDPAYMVAPRKQRAAAAAANSATRSKRIEVISSSAADDADADDEDSDLETEFVQTVVSADATAAVALTHIVGEEDNQSNEKITYGFNSEFSGVFRGLDEETALDAVELPNPDDVLPQDRRILREEQENADFDEDAMWCSLGDEEGEVESILRDQTPNYVSLFEDALTREGVAYASRRRQAAHHGGGVSASTTTRGEEEEEDIARRKHRDTLVEEEEAVPLSEGDGQTVVSLWEGNVEVFGAPPLNTEEKNNRSTLPHIGGDAVEEEEGTAGQHKEEVECVDLRGMHDGRPRQTLAVPAAPVTLTWTMDESDALQRLGRTTNSIKAVPPPSPPNNMHVAALTVDLLLAQIYDHLTTDGHGSSESVWTLCKLSPSLSYLDTQPTLYDVCVAFARRVCIYPLHRHLDLIRRCFRDVGILCMLGPHSIIRALLAVKKVLDHSEHKMVLSTMFLNPLITFWLRKPAAEAYSLLLRMALDMHEIAVMTQPKTVVVIADRDDDKRTGGSSLLRVAPRTRVLEPINIATIGLPIVVGG